MRRYGIPILLWSTWNLTAPSVWPTGGVVVENFGPDWTLLFTLQCTKFGQLIVRKIIKIVASRCVS